MGNGEGAARRRAAPSGPPGSAEAATGREQPLRRRCRACAPPEGGGAGCACACAADGVE